MSTENSNTKHPCTIDSICCCDNCGLPETEQAIVKHYDENWCLDCMRHAGHCISCDAYIPDLVEDYFNYENDDCPACVASNLI
jgi:hypothetical protein